MANGRKKTGGKYIKRRKKKAYERAGQENLVKLGDEKRKSKFLRGKKKRTILLRGKTINVSDGKKITKQGISNVIQTPSNRFFARQNIITKGTIVETPKGKVKITNSPTKESIINGTLLKE
ncbi:MAG: 30S ribosomal protein S8e [Nanoarchaeota archaeon]